MRPLFALTFVTSLALALTGCTRASATYRIDGADQTLSVRAEQDYFWSKALSVSVVTARLPDCQRKLELGKVPQADFDLAVFDSGANIYTLSTGEQIVQVNIETCTNLGEPREGASGLPVGNFKFDDKNQKLVFLKAKAAS